MKHLFFTTPEGKRLGKGIYIPIEQWQNPQEDMQAKETPSAAHSPSHTPQEETPLGSSPTQWIMMVTEQASTDGDPYSSTSSELQTSPSHNRHPLLPSPPAGPIVHRDLHNYQLQNPPEAHLSEQHLLSLQQQLQGLLQMVGTGGTELHRQMQIFSAQTLQEFDQVRHLLSAANVSSADKWSTLSQWAYKVDSFLTEFTTKSLP
jgi:hypothetical protein